MAATAPLSLAGLLRGSGYFTFGGATFYAREDYTFKVSPTFEILKAYPYGRVDEWKKDFVIEHELMLYGAWANLAVLFPSYAMNPVAGASIFPAADASITPLIWNGKDGARLTFHNTKIVGIPECQLGVDAELFAAAVKFRTIIRPGYLPTDAAAYFTRDAATYAEPGFDKTTLYKARWTGAWSSVTGFTSLVPQAGFRVKWDLALEEQKFDGYGVVDMTIKDEGMIGTVSAIVAGPTLPQFDTASGFLVSGVASDLGTLLGANAHDLTLTAGAHSVLMSNASLIEYAHVSSVSKLRTGSCTWKTIRGFDGTTHAPTAVSTIA